MKTKNLQQLQESPAKTETDIFNIQKMIISHLFIFGDFNFYCFGCLLVFEAKNTGACFVVHTIFYHRSTDSSSISVKKK